MKTFLIEKENEMIVLLEKLVSIDSGSRDKVGVDKISNILQKEYEKLGFMVETNYQEVQGDHLVIRHKNAENPEIMSVAHMDTVFAKGTALKRPFTIREKRAYGPGVIDMKASHVVLLYALKSLQETVPE